MYFIGDNLLQLAIDQFHELKIVENDTKTGDQFFQTFCPGNTMYWIDRPHERFSDYELLLDKLFIADKDKYKAVHKGTPFYFLAWTAFDLRNYEKAVYYLDNAISEDIKNNPSRWWETPGTKALRLISNGSGPIFRTVYNLRASVKNQVDRFNSIGVNNIEVSDISENLAYLLMSDKNKSARSIITSLYSFIFEFEERNKELKLRSDFAGSLEPVLLHLFKGGVIFESLLKYFYPQVQRETLNIIFKNKDVIKDFKIGELYIRSNNFQDVLNVKKKGIEGAFEMIGKIRNMSGHNLVWDDVFGNIENYEHLFYQEVNAIFYILCKKL